MKGNGATAPKNAHTAIMSSGSVVDAFWKCFHLNTNNECWTVSVDIGELQAHSKRWRLNKLTWAMLCNSTTSSILHWLKHVSHFFLQLRNMLSAQRKHYLQHCFSSLNIPFSRKLINLATKKHLKFFCNLIGIPLRLIPCLVGRNSSHSHGYQERQKRWVFGIFWSDYRHQMVPR